jgi:hypothetical protein
MSRVEGARYLAILAVVLVLSTAAWILNPIWGERPPLEFSQGTVELSPACQEVWMSDPDKEAFVRALMGRGVRQYLEWGGGGSTFCAAGLVEHGTSTVCTSLPLITANPDPRRSMLSQ